MQGPLLSLLILFRSINKRGHHKQLFFLLGHIKKSCPLKSHGQMNQNLAGSIYGRSCIMITNFVLIR